MIYRNSSQLTERSPVGTSLLTVLRHLKKSFGAAYNLKSITLCSKLPQTMIMLLETFTNCMSSAKLKAMRTADQNECQESDYLRV